MPKPLVWVKIKTSETAPSPRLGHTLVEMERDLYIMYGGLDVNSKVEGNIIPSKDVYALRVTQKGEYIWALIECDGDEIPLLEPITLLAKSQRMRCLCSEDITPQRADSMMSTYLKSPVPAVSSFPFCFLNILAKSLFPPWEDFGSSFSLICYRFIFQVLISRQEVHMDAASQPEVGKGHPKEH